MQLNIAGQHLEITEALHHRVVEKFQRLEHYYDKITHVYVVLKVEKSEQIAEATLHVSGAELHASAEKKDMYEAIDQLVDKLERQLIKHKEKLKSY